MTMTKKELEQEVLRLREALATIQGRMLLRDADKPWLNVGMSSGVCLIFGRAVGILLAAPSLTFEDAMSWPDPATHTPALRAALVGPEPKPKP